MRAHYRCPDDLGNFFTQCISFFRSLHQSRNDVLLCSNATEEIALCYRISLIVEDRWVTWMGYEIGEVCTFWQMTCKWCCCIKRNNHCAWLQLVDNACCNLADNGIWNSQNNDFCAFQ